MFENSCSFELCDKHVFRSDTGESFTTLRYRFDTKENRRILVDVAIFIKFKVLIIKFFTKLIQAVQININS